jgi:hypothetical protein
VFKSVCAYVVACYWTSRMSHSCNDHFFLHKMLYLFGLLGSKTAVISVGVFLLTHLIMHELIGSF